MTADPARDLAEVVAGVLAEHEDCTMNDTRGSIDNAAAVTGRDVWSCGIVLDFEERMADAERAHLTAAVVAALPQPDPTPATGADRETVERWADDHFTQGEVTVVMRLFDLGWRGPATGTDQGGACPIRCQWSSTPEGCDCARRLAAVTTHTRAQTDYGPDYCQDCSEAVSEWVQWPCAGSQAADQGGVLTEAERQQVIDTGRHVYGCCADDCPDHGLPEDAQIRVVERIFAARLAGHLVRMPRWPGRSVPVRQPLLSSELERIKQAQRSALLKAARIAREGVQRCEPCAAGRHGGCQGHRVPCVCTCGEASDGGRLG